MASVYELINGAYITIFNRAADPQGAGYWAGQLGFASIGAAAGATATLAQADNLGAQFYNTPNGKSVFDTLYLGLNDHDFITQLYVNLGNTGPDGGGLTYWQNRLTQVEAENPGSTQLARAMVASEVSFALQNYNPNDPAFQNLTQAEKDAAANRAATYKNKIAVSQAVVETGNPNFNPTSTSDAAYNGEVAIIQGIDETTASLNAALASVSAADAADDPSLLITTPTNYTLKLGPDVASATHFDAPVVTTQLGIQAQTLESVDVLTGKGTNPTLDAVLNASSQATPTITGVPTLNFSINPFLGVILPAAIDLQKTTGAQTINLDARASIPGLLGISGLLAENIQNKVDIGVKNGNIGIIPGSGINGKFEFVQSVVSGADDTLNVNLTNNGKFTHLSANNAAVAFSNGDTTAAGTTFGAFNASGLGSDGFETFNVTATGDNHIFDLLSDPTTFIGFGSTASNVLSALKIGGAGSLWIDNVLTNVTTVDATGNGGGIRVSLDTAKDVKVDGGSGDDTFVFGFSATTGGASGLDLNDQVDGHGGRNTLAVTDLEGLDNSNGHIKNIQILEVDGVGATTKVDLSQISSIDTVVHNTTIAATYNNFPTLPAAQLVLLDTGAVTVNVKDATSPGHISDQLNVVLGSADGDLGVNAGGLVGPFTAEGVETVNVNVIRNTNSAGVAVTAPGFAAGITDTDLQVVNVKGGSAGEGFFLDLSGNASANLQLIDAHSFIGDATLIGNGGAFFSNTNNQVIIGGSGNDVLDTGGRPFFGPTFGDILTGNGGADTFTFRITDSDLIGWGGLLANTNFSKADLKLFDTITDLALGASASKANDHVDLDFALGAGFSGGINASANNILNGGLVIDQSASANLGAAITNVSALFAGNILGGLDQAALFTFAGQTFLYATNDKGAGGVGFGTDIVIDVTGVTGHLTTSVAVGVGTFV